MGWVPTTGPRPDEILIKDNIIKNCLQDGMFLFLKDREDGFARYFPLEPIVTGNRLLNNGRAGIYVSNVYYYSQEMLDQIFSVIVFPVTFGESIMLQRSRLML